MAHEQTERTAAILDSASTWHGVARVVRSGHDRGTTTLRVDGRAIGRVREDAVDAHLPGKLPRTAVRHGLAATELGDGWTRLDLSGETTVHDAVVLLRVAYLSRVASARGSRPDAFPDVDLAESLAELDLSPGTIHLIQDLARGS